MKIRTKTIGILAILAFTLIIAIYSISYNIILHNFYDLEREGLLRNMERTINALSERMDEIDRINRDWSRWDNTYYYMQNRNTDYELANFDRETFEIIKVDQVVYIDIYGNITYSRSYDHSQKIEREINEIEKMKTIKDTAWYWLNIDFYDSLGGKANAKCKAVLLK